MKKILFILLLFLSTPLCAQRSLYDSLMGQLGQHPEPDSVRLNLLLQIAQELRFINPESIYPIANEALKIAEETGDIRSVAMAYNRLGEYYREKGLYNKAIDYFYNSLRIMQELGDEAGIARSYNLIGIIYYYLEQYDLSLSYYMMALDINEKQNDVKWIAANSNNIGMIYERMNRFDEALKYYRRATEMSLRIGNQNWLANIYGNLGSLYMKMKDPRALEYLNKRLEIKLQQEDTIGLSRSYYLLGTYYNSIQDFDRALPFLQKSFKLLEPTEQLAYKTDCLEQLSIAWAGKKDYKNAFLTHKRFEQYSDSLDILSGTLKLTRMMMQHELTTKQRDAELKKQKRKFWQITLLSILAFLIILAILLNWRARMRHKEKEQIKRKLQLENLSLEDELAYKSKIMQDHIQYLLEQNELITSIVESLEKSKEKVNPDKHELIHQTIMDLKSGSQMDDENEFELRFREVHHEFYQKLLKLHPNLTPNELRLCAYLKMNMTTNEISSLTGQSVKSVEAARSRLRNKLGLKDKSQSLRNYLKGI
ncbi:MAG: hypothetical protein Kow00127_00650 [Bacteroidales bacterium]